MIIVNMDTAKRAAYQRVQHISSPVLQAAYADKRRDVPDVWGEAMRAVVKGLNPDAPPLQVPIVVLTLTPSGVKLFHHTPSDTTTPGFTIGPTMARA